MTLDKMLDQAERSGQSEARAIAECIRDALEDCDEAHTMVPAMCDEFIGWATAIKTVIRPEPESTSTLKT